MTRHSVRPGSKVGNRPLADTRLVILDSLDDYMDHDTPTPGLTVAADGEGVVIRVEPAFAGAMLAILLHSKFADGPRLEFLTSPYTNCLIQALIAAASLPSETWVVPTGMAQAFAPSI